MNKTKILIPKFAEIVASDPDWLPYARKVDETVTNITYVVNKNRFLEDGKLIPGKMKLPRRLDSLEVKSFEVGELYSLNTLYDSVGPMDYIFNESAYDILRGFHPGLDGRELWWVVFEDGSRKQRYYTLRSMKYKLATFEMLYAYLKSPESEVVRNSGRKIIALGSLHKLASGTWAVPMFDPKYPNRIGLVSPLGNWSSPWGLDEVGYLVYGASPGIATNQS